MKTTKFDGIYVKKLEYNEHQKNILGSGPYEYFIYVTKENEEFQIEELNSLSIYILYKSENATILVHEFKNKLSVGDVVQIENTTVNIKIYDGIAKFLISGTKHPCPKRKGISFTKEKDIYRVQKPWGYELWLNGQHPCYALKKIFIKAGTKTSLQYHRIKKETNVLFEGIAKLHYKNNPLITNDLVKSSDVTSVSLDPISVVDIPSLTLHRLEAITDILLFETSTPHLDDVVRVQDDSNRANGRLIAEHIHS